MQIDGSDITFKTLRFHTADTKANDDAEVSLTESTEVLKAEVKKNAPAKSKFVGLSRCNRLEPKVKVAPLAAAVNEVQAAKELEMQEKKQKQRNQQKKQRK